MLALWSCLSCVAEVDSEAESGASEWRDATRLQQEAVYCRLARDPEDLGLARQALSLALLGKGRAHAEATALSEYIHEARDPVLRMRFDELREVRGRIARATLSQRDASASAKLELRAMNIERELARSFASKGARRELPAADEIVSRVAAALPSGSALVEFIAFRQAPPGSVDLSPEAFQVHYLALVLLDSGAVGVADLGTGEELDDVVRPALNDLRDPRSDLRGLQALHGKLFAPLVPLLRGRRSLLVAPDGQLHRVPFAALHDGSRFVADDFRIAYLTSGRDLLDLAPVRGRSREILILGAPSFSPESPGPPGHRPDNAIVADRSRSSPSPARGSFAELPGARAEVRSMRALFPEARFLTGAEATVQGLLGSVAPAILHVPTHGIFWAIAPGNTANPWLSSALVLAGAGDRAEAAASPADGLVTALEVLGMDLWGTQLVVLSACDSGRGRQWLGGGLYGLRSAFLIAGAQTVVSSLWEVDDEVTATLMASYYRLLLAGEGRADAMRDAARVVRASHPHPHYWTPFIVTGRTAPIAKFGH